MQQPETIERVIELSEPQSDVLAARTSLILDMAGQGAGKTENIAMRSGYFVTQFPKAKGFIAANTYLQLTQSTLNKAARGWQEYYGLTEYDPKTNPGGQYVIDRKPPAFFTCYERLKNYHNTISFRNGAMIYVGSLDNFKAHDGKEFAWADLDETKDTKREALSTVILARLRQYGLWSDQDGECHWDEECTPEQAEERGWKSWNPCSIHTSPAEGGVDWLIEMFNLAKKEEIIRKTLADPYKYFYDVDGELTTVIYQTYWNEHNLPPGHIEKQKARMSEAEQLKFIDGYPFSKTGGEFFPGFIRRYHVGKVPYLPGVAVHLSFDFNVVPYMTMLCAQVKYVTRYWDAEKRIKTAFPVQGAQPMEVMQIRLFKEFCMKSPLNTTEDTARQFIINYGFTTNIDVMVYGDASGRNRMVGLGSLTQYKIIEGVLGEYLPNHWNRVPLANMAVLKRRDLMNRILEGKIPEVELYFDEGMENTIKDFEYVKLGVDGKVKEKAKDPNTGMMYEKNGHTSDATEYLVCEICKPFIKDY